jgi:N-ethylmaleimide reductase
LIAANRSKAGDDRLSYYGDGARGYTDYPTLAHERGEQPKPCVDDSWR